MAWRLLGPLTSLWQVSSAVWRSDKGKVIKKLKKTCMLLENFSRFPVKSVCFAVRVTADRSHIKTANQLVLGRRLCRKWQPVEKAQVCQNTKSYMRLCSDPSRDKETPGLYFPLHHLGFYSNFSLHCTIKLKFTSGTMKRIKKIQLSQIQ